MVQENIDNGKKRAIQRCAISPPLAPSSSAANDEFLASLSDEDDENEGELTLASSSSPASSPLSPPEYYKWHVYTRDDDFGNKIWIEYPEEVGSILDKMYKQTSTHEDKFYLYEWRNSHSRRQTVFSAKCQGG